MMLAVSPRTILETSRLKRIVTVHCVHEGKNCYQQPVSVELSETVYLSMCMWTVERAWRSGR